MLWNDFLFDIEFIACSQNLIRDFMFITCSWFITNSSNISHVRQIYCKFVACSLNELYVRQIYDSSNSWFDNSRVFLFIFLHMFWFSIKLKIDVYCSICVLFEIVFSLWNICTNITKTFFVLWKVKTIDFFRSMCSKRFMMKKFCIEKCQSRYIHVDFAIIVFKIISSNRLIQINF